MVERSMVSRKHATLLALLLLSSAGAATKGPDAFGYKADDKPTFSFIDISGLTAGKLAGADDDQAEIALGFTFQFYGTAYTTVCANANGFLTLGPCDASLAHKNFANVDLATAAPQGNQPMIAVYWTDLTFMKEGSGAVFYQTSGVSGSKKFVLQWNQAYPQNGTAGISFEAVLYEGTNQILLQYANTVVNSSAFDNGATAMAGIRDTSGDTNGRNLKWSYKSPVIANSTAISFSLPTVMYQLTTNVNPAAAGTVTGAGSYSTGSLATVTATANSGYQFAFWSGDAAGNTATIQVPMTGARTVTANFQQLTGPPQLTLTQLAHSDGTVAGTRIAPMKLANAGTGMANAAQIISISAITTTGGSGTVTVASTLPMTVGDLAPGQNATANVIFNWPASATRIMLTVTFGANSGGYKNATTVSMYR